MPSLLLKGPAVEPLTLDEARAFLRVDHTDVEVIANFGAVAFNPMSTMYDVMIAPDGIHVWTWDARPYPIFPADTTAWSDGPNWGWRRSDHARELERDTRPGRGHVRFWSYRRGELERRRYCWFIGFGNDRYDQCGEYYVRNAQQYAAIGCGAD